MRPNEQRAPSPAEVQTARAVSDHVNRNPNPKGLAQALAHDHPTLQQGVMRLFVAFVREMADKPYADDRNQASVDLARKLVDEWDTDPKLNGGPYLPFI